jgi:hypothetical protein
MNKGSAFNLDGFVKSLESHKSVIPAGPVPDVIR